MLIVSVSLPAVVHDPKAPVAEGTLHTDRDGNTKNAGERAQEAKHKAQEVKEDAREKKEEAKGAAQEAKRTHDQTGPGGLRERAKETARSNDDPVSNVAVALSAPSSHLD